MLDLQTYFFCSCFLGIFFSSGEMIAKTQPTKNPILENVFVIIRSKIYNTLQFLKFYKNQKVESLTLPL